MSTVSQLYKSVIDDVINNVREAFLDEGVDEQILTELKQIWENKLTQSKAVPPEGVLLEPEHSIAQQFTIQPQPHQNTQPALLRNAKYQTIAGNAKQKELQLGAKTLQPQIPAGGVIQGGVQYQYTTGELGEGSKTLTFTLPQGNPKQVAIAIPAMHLQTPTGLVMSTPAAAAASALPPGIAAGLLQPSLAAFNAGMITHQNSDGTTVQYQAVTAEQLAKQGFTLNMTQGASQQAAAQVQQVQLTNNGGVIQLDGREDSSEDDDDDDDDFKDDENDQDDDNEQNEDENDAAGEEEDPLNSGDDVSDEDPSELFDTDNVIVCQYDKITRSRNKWKFHLKDGIMNLQGKDFVFQRASGDAEW